MSRHRHYGCLPKTPDTRDFRAAPRQPYTGQFVDLTSGFQPVYDQGQLGSCVAQGTAAAVDFARVEEGLPPIGPSRLFIYYNGRALTGQPASQDTGLQIRDGFTSISRDGAPPETDWPYDITKFAAKPPNKAYADGTLDEAVTYGAVAPGDIDATIASGYPVVFGFSVYESFESPAVAKTGVMPIPGRNERQLGGHCVVAVSTIKDGSEIAGGVSGVKYRLARNSWGPEWGLGGYFYMPASIMDSPDADCWQVTLMTSPDKPVPPVDPDAAMVAAATTWLTHSHSSLTDKALAPVMRLWLASK